MGYAPQPADILIPGATRPSLLSAGSWVILGLRAPAR